MTIKRHKQSLTAVDLFCGGGGLTIGIKRAGFDVVGAVEIEPHAAATYQANHLTTKLFIQDIQYLKGKDLLKLTPHGSIDLLAGCPPCQGFTSLTAKYHREDPRNLLLFEMLRLIKETKPSIVMMENVPGLVNRGKPLLDKMVASLKKLGYCVQTAVLQVADYGIPQFRRRFVLLGGLNFFIPFPKPTHSRNAENGLPKWNTVYKAISGVGEPMTYSSAKAKAVFPTDWHVVRDLNPINKERLKIAKAGESWKTIPEHLRPRCHQGGYYGFPNVYGRMSWDNVSPTITGGCTTLSRGRFGHPVENRTISVREAATIQTFPNDYIFDTISMDCVCNIIGNALPCDFAAVLAEQCYNALVNHRLKDK